MLSFFVIHTCLSLRSLSPSLTSIQRRNRLMLRWTSREFVFRMETFSYETIVSRGQTDEFLFNTRWSLNCFSKYKILGKANKLETWEFFRGTFRRKRVCWISTIRLQPKKIFCIFPEVIRFHHQNEKLSRNSELTKSFDWKSSWRLLRCPIV